MIKPAVHTCDISELRQAFHMLEKALELSFDQNVSEEITKLLCDAHATIAMELMGMFERDMEDYDNNG